MRGRVALVTGASSGIGRATAAALCEEGYRVMAVARRRELLKQLGETTGASYFACSLDSPDGCRQAVEVTRSELGPIEVLVNNAAKGSTDDGSVLEITEDAWRSSMSLNLDSPLWLTQLAAKDMVAAGFGRVVMVSSTAGQVGDSGMIAYCASKHGLLGIMRAAAMDLASHGVTCNAVLPGWVRTEMAERKAVQEAEQRGITTDAIWQERAASYPGGRLVTEEEVAEAITFLVSDRASGINGETITVTGGGLW